MIVDLINLDRFKLTTDPKKGATVFEFYNGDKQTGEFLAPKTLRDRSGEVNTMKNSLGIVETPPALERSLEAATKLRRESPTDTEMESISPTELSSLAEDIHAKIREASQNYDLDMRDILGVDKALQTIEGELVNNITKLIEINEPIKRDGKKLNKVEDDPTYSEEQRQLYKDRLDELNIEKQARLEILLQNRKNLQMQVTRIKQTIEKVLIKIHL